MLKTTCIVLIKIYQRLMSPFFVRSCRFYPTCSEYARQAISHRGAISGLKLSIKRLSKCHPWHPGGIDEIGAPI